MTKLKYSIIFLHFCTYWLSTKTQDVKNHCSDILDVYTHLLLKLNPKIVLPVITFDELELLQNGESISIPNIPRGGIGIFKGPDHNKKNAEIIEELRHFEQVTKHLGPQQPTGVQGGVRNTPHVGIYSAEKSRTLRTNEVSHHHKPGDINFQQFSTYNRGVNQIERTENSRIAGLTARLEGNRRVSNRHDVSKIIPYHPVANQYGALKHEAQKAGLHSGSMVQMGQYQQEVFSKHQPQLGSHLYQQYGNQNIDTQMGSHRIQGEDYHLGGNQNIGYSSKIGYRNREEELLAKEQHLQQMYKYFHILKNHRAHPQEGGPMIRNRYNRQLSANLQQSSAEESQGDRLGFYLAEGVVGGQVGQERSRIKYGKKASHGKKVKKPKKSHRIDENVLTPKAESIINEGDQEEELEVIEPGGVREVVNGGQKVFISNTNCPDESELCISIV